MKVQIHGTVDMEVATELERVARINKKKPSHLFAKILTDWFDARDKEVTCKCGAKHAGVLDICPSCGENHV